MNNFNTLKTFHKYLVTRMASSPSPSMRRLLSHLSRMVYSVSTAGKSLDEHTCKEALGTGQLGLILKAHIETARALDTTLGDFLHHVNEGTLDTDEGRMMTQITKATYAQFASQTEIAEERLLAIAGQTPDRYDQQFTSQVTH